MRKTSGNHKKKKKNQRYLLSSSWPDKVQEKHKIWIPFITASLTETVTVIENVSLGQRMLWMWSSMSTFFLVNQRNQIIYFKKRSLNKAWWVMSSLENSDDHTSATEWSKDNLKVKGKASASPWFEETWQGRRNWCEVHLPPEETITKDVPHAGNSLQSSTAEAGDGCYCTDMDSGGSSSSTTNLRRLKSYII